MVSRLRRPKSKLDIQLFGGPSFHPGDTVKGRIDLYAKESFYIREGRIQLICDHVAHDYENREYRSSESGDIRPEETIIVRAHMNDYGYGGVAMRGSVMTGFTTT